MGDLEWPAPSTKAVTTNDTNSPGLRNTQTASTRGCLCPPSPSSFPQRVKKPHNNIKRLQPLRSWVYFPSSGRKIKSFLSFALAVWGLWMKFPDGTWSANLFSPEQVPGSWRDSRAPSALCPGSQRKVIPVCGTCGWDSPFPHALCSSKHSPACEPPLVFQATDSMCYLHGIVSKIPQNLKWGGCFPSATPTLGTAAPEPQSGQFPSWWLWAKTRDAHEVKFQADEEAEIKIRQSFPVPEFFFKGVWFRAYFLFIFMELLPKRFSWKYKLPSTGWHVGSIFFLNWDARSIKHTFLDWC